MACSIKVRARLRAISRLYAFTPPICWGGLYFAPVPIANEQCGDAGEAFGGSRWLYEPVGWSGRFAGGGEL
jgi:hypothetical protein